MEGGVAVVQSQNGNGVFSLSSRSHREFKPSISFSDKQDGRDLKATVSFSNIEDGRELNASVSSGRYSSGRSYGTDYEQTFGSFADMESLSHHSHLEHCATAPIQIPSTSRTSKYNFSLTRSKTEKRETEKYERRLDKLLEQQKKKILGKLAKVQNDYRVEVDFNKSVPVASELLQFDSIDSAPADVGAKVDEPFKSVPRLRIVILVVGTRGDVQPFIAIAKRLQTFGHRVRLATHANFKDFVTSADIEFYPLGGDPRILAGYMAKNKGFLPSAPSEISIQREQLKVIINSMLPACTEPDMDSGKPFTAEAIIANPPAYGHIHVAEALNVPIHIFFTMPWTPTNEFPHPLAQVTQAAANRLSYILVDLLIWWGIMGLVNEFRKRKLSLSPIAYFSTYRGSLSHLPTSYMWSPCLVRKPDDWGTLVDVVGYCFLSHTSNYQPKEDFSEWIKAGEKPVYIGFGSMIIDNPKKTTTIIIEALKKTGQRGIIDRGWAGLGNVPDVPHDVFVLQDCPHDWLFPQCSSVVHHGGAGTTATGLKAGCPTTIIPFFGDQFFWGDRIRDRGIGPAPIPYSELTTDRLADAIRFMLDPQVKLLAVEISENLANEDGVAEAVDTFHRHLPSELPLPNPKTNGNGSSHHHDHDDEQPPDNFFVLFLLGLQKWFCLPCLS